MPAAACHYIHAEKVRDILLDDFKVKNLCDDAFYWGAQGADFFFCYRLLPWMMGKKIHGLGESISKVDKNALILALADRVAETDDSELHSYLYGILCNYAYDTVAHPYINQLAERLLEDHAEENESTVYNEIESALDTILLRHEKNQLPTEKSLRFYFPKNKKIMEKISRLWAETLKSFMELNISDETVLQAEKDAISVASALTDRTAIKKNFLSKLEKGGPHTISCHIRPFMEDADIDFANINKLPWGNNNDADFFELTKKAEKKAAEFIRSFIEGDISSISA